jgi:hypothetical protein
LDSLWRCGSVVTDHPTNNPDLAASWFPSLWIHWEPPDLQAVCKKLRHEASYYVLATDTCRWYLLSRDASLCVKVGQMFKYGRCRSDVYNMLIMYLEEIEVRIFPSRHHSVSCLIVWNSCAILKQWSLVQLCANV